MEKALVSFICWNRAGLNARNLNALLKSTDDFELYKITQNAYKEVKSEYSIDNGARQVIDVINDIVNQ